MAEAVLMGAGIGAGASLLTGRDPVKGAIMGGAVGGAGSAFSGAGAAGAGASAGGASVPTVPSHLVGTGGSTIGAGTGTGVGLTVPSHLVSPPPVESGLLGSMGEWGSKINDFTGMENKDWTMLAMNNMDKLTPEQQVIAHQQISNVSGKPIEATPPGQVNSGGPLTQSTGTPYPDYYRKIRIGG